MYEIIWREYRDEPWNTYDVTNNSDSIELLVYNCQISHPMAVVQVRYR